MILLPVQEPLIKLTTLNDNRPKYQDVFFAVLFLLLNVVAFSLQIVFIVRGMKFMTWYNCVSAFTTDRPTEIFVIGVAGVFQNGGGQVLSMAVTACFLFSGLWIYMLRNCAKTIVWGTYILGWFGVLAFIFFVKNNTHLMWTDAAVITPLILLFISGVVILTRRDSINRAARVMATACTALAESPCLFAFTFVLQLMQLMYFAFYMYSFVHSYFAYPVLASAPPNSYGNILCGYVDRDLIEDSTAHFSPPRDWVYIASYFSALVFLWNVFFGDALRLFVTTGVMAEWFFNSEERRRSTCSTVSRFWKWALTVQLGTLAVSALVSTAMQKLKNWAKINGCCCCCPHVWIARIILCMIQSCVATITRFNLAYAAISGDGFSRSVKNSYDIIFGAFGDAVTNELTAGVVLNFATLIFSCAVGLLAWAATAYRLGEGVFVFVDVLVCEDSTSSYCSTFNTIIHTIMFGFSGWVAYNTLLGLFLLIMFPAIWTSTLGQCVYLGVLSMLIARLIFTFVGGLIQDSTTGMYMCAAIDKQNGTTSPKRHFIDEVMKEEHCPIAWYTTVATTPVTAISVYTTPPVQLYQTPMPHYQPPPPPPVSYQTYQQSYPHQQFHTHQHQYPPATPTFQPTLLSPYQLASPNGSFVSQPSCSSVAQHCQSSLPPSTAPALTDAPPPYISDPADFTFNCKSCQTPIADDARFCGKCGLSR